MKEFYVVQSKILEFSCTEMKLKERTIQKEVQETWHAWQTI
jgi:hypothetical protein